MRSLIQRSLAAAELLLVFPAALFLSALFVRSIQPQQYEPAHTAQEIVDWYAARPHLGLWILMIALPLIVLIAGCLTLLRSWRADSGLREAAQQAGAAFRAHLATFLIACATVSAFGILAIVAVHLISG